MITTSCLQCGKEFSYVRKNQYLKKDRIFCSRSCSTKHQMKSMSKEDFKIWNEKRSNTLNEKYGGYQLSHIEDFVEKTKETKTKKYGVSYFNNTEKRRNTNLEKKWEYINSNITHCIPNFSFNEYSGTSHHYNWVCNDCQMEYSSNLTKIVPKICPKCNINKMEREIFEFLQNDCQCDNVILHDRKILYPKEIDFYLPDSKLGIEFNGLYWHSEQNGKNKNYHHDKLLLAKKKNIQLIQIFEDEWVFKKDIVKSRLKNKLNLINNRIYARNCIIREITKEEKKQFLNDNHIQGNDKSSIYIGAFYNDELVSIITFGKPRIALNQIKHLNGDFELIRFCSKVNYVVIGIFDKMLKFFIKKNKSLNNIITFSDNRWGDGSLYKKANFEMISNGIPNYWYFKNMIRYHRFGFRKFILKDRLENYNHNLTEVENMKNNGYDRIWDCGSTKWIYKNI